MLDKEKFYKFISSPYFIGAIFVVVILFVFSLGPKEEPEDVFVEEIPEISLFDNLSVEAESVIVWDVLNKEVLYEKNSEAQLPLASLTKVLLAKVAFDSIGGYTSIPITADSLSPSGDHGLIVSEEWVLEDLIDFMLVSSSNDSSKAVASAFASSPRKLDIIDAMNEEAKKLGLNQTFFLNESGLDETSVISGAYGSAKDIAILFEKILKENPRLLEATSRSEIRTASLDAPHYAKNTNHLTENLAGVVASKTGFTDLAGGNLVMAFELGPMRTYIIALMGSSMDKRFSDMEKLYLTLQSEIAKTE